MSLPVTKVIVYKNGVAFFEREAWVENNESLTVSFKAAEMNDIIRTINAEDLDRGRIANIAYQGSVSPISEVPFNDPTGDPNYTNKLLIGSNVTLTQKNEEVISGRIVNTYTEQGIKMLELYVANSKLVVVEARSIASLQIADAHVNENIKEVLDISLDAKRKEGKQVTIRCEGTGKRKVRISYILESPIWKSNYRIHMRTGSEKETFLEGWACVDNTTVDHWESIKLSLVSGSPISFRHEVYSPVIGIRPTKFSNEGKNSRIEQTRLIRTEVQRRAEPHKSAQGLSNPNAGVSVDRPEKIKPIVDIESQIIEIGNVFQYDIKSPISVRSNQSSLVPTISGAFEGKKVCWFDPNIHTAHALEGVLLKNTLGVVLDNGPVVVTENGNYQGESLLENDLLQNEEILLPYSVNLELKVEHSNTKEYVPTKVEVINGQLLFTTTKLITRKYVITNNADADLELALDHSDDFNQKVEGINSFTKFKEFTRFFVSLPRKKQTPLNVPTASEYVTNPKTTLLSQSKFELANNYLQGNINKEGYRLLSRFFDEAERVGAMKDKLLEGQQHENLIIADEQRVQSLMTSMRSDTESLEKQINALEQQLSNSREDRNKLADEWKQARAGLLVRLNSIYYESSVAEDKPTSEERAEINKTLGVLSKLPIESFLGEIDLSKLQNPAPQVAPRPAVPPPAVGKATQPPKVNPKFSGVL